MPHIIIDYSQSLKTIVQTEKVKDELLKTLVENSDFEPKAIKYRTLYYEDFQGEQKDFIHLTIKLLSGRTLDQRKKISQSAGACLSKLFDQHQGSLSLTVEIQEIERDSYFKQILG